MDIGQCVITMDGSSAVVVNLNGGHARVCYLTPNNRLSYISADYLVTHLKPVPKHRSAVQFHASW